MSIDLDQVQFAAQRNPLKLAAHVRSWAKDSRRKYYLFIDNELVGRGFSVDVGVVENWERDERGKSVRKTREIDFVVNKGGEKVYVQSAYRLATDEK